MRRIWISLRRIWILLHQAWILLCRALISLSGFWFCCAQTCRPASCALESRRLPNVLTVPAAREGDLVQCRCAPASPRVSPSDTEGKSYDRLIQITPKSMLSEIFSELDAAGRNDRKQTCALISVRFFRAERSRHQRKTAKLLLGSRTISIEFSRSIIGDNQMKRVVLTFLSAAAVCAALSATPAAAQDTVTGAPVGEAPVTVEGYGSSSGYPGPSSASRSPRLRAP